jgi:hypothetical protein
VNATALLDELTAAGVFLTRTGDDFRVRTRPGVSIAPYRERIRAHKPDLVIAFLHADILEAAEAVGDAFDESTYDRLWAQWHRLARRQPIAACPPPEGWEGTLCDGCRWPAMCRVLGPRGPHLPDGPCPAWSQDRTRLATESGEAFDLSIMVAQLQALTPEELEQYRQEVHAATPDDPYVMVDREALIRFDCGVSPLEAVS